MVGHNYNYYSPPRNASESILHEMYDPLQVCCVDVSAGVCPATSGQAGGEALLSSLSQHTTTG